MFKSKNKSTIDSLIGASTNIEGDIHFKGGLRIDGHVTGNVIAEAGTPSILVISEQAVIDGEVRAGHVVVNGVINGPVISTELIELQSKARISGDVHYKALEMMNGALVSGKLAHDQVAEPVLKLAASN
ncbi:polymer-forming cytoskeletal protein [Undibacterium sp. LX40W]|jgi:cytoskeletal protein CcmA (bactofilin family)|uniref:Polymer-forming cytoskeletal protein n=1 Tax=Undibacterium nitidum TaxID=2762298 RepID=A0A923HU75_9BURK|nr:MULTISPECIES: polymer-forming cytoskeletal protein [Undibacterium]MBC3881304.1 polymer-forming cytoskeletal protein [Undibacterium nitidum]MBC3891913.1 polymer-forming cytoskeletal protein [Undibacterium sp. LX40W]